MDGPLLCPLFVASPDQLLRNINGLSVRHLISVTIQIVRRTVESCACMRDSRPIETTEKSAVLLHLMDCGVMVDHASHLNGGYSKEHAVRVAYRLFTVRVQHAT